MINRWRSLRKSTHVDTPIQGRILGRIAAYWFVYHFVLWNGLFLFRYIQYRMAITSGAEALSFRQLYGQFCADFYPLIVCAALILPLFLWDFVKMTHRIAAPLCGFRNALRELRAGRRVEHVETRQRHMFNEFQAEFNEFLKYYNSHRTNSDSLSDARTVAVDLMSEEDAVTVAEITGDTASPQGAEFAETAIMIKAT